jgi:uncharacterized repeat protein (TIGR01451 family)
MEEVCPVLPNRCFLVIAILALLLSEVLNVNAQVWNPVAPVLASAELNINPDRQIDSRTHVSPRSPLVRTNANTSRRGGNQEEQAIAINLTNPRNIVVVSNDETVAPHGIWKAYSMDGGATWTGADIASGVDGLSAACCDPSLAFDQFGNLFLTYLEGVQGYIGVVMSSDGGKTFGGMQTVAIPVHPGFGAKPFLAPRGPGVGAPTGGNDQPTVSTGPGTGGAGSTVWVTFTDSSDQINITGAAVTGLGAVGTFSAPEAGGAGVFGDIAVGPNGQVMVTYVSLNSGAGPDTARVQVDPDGLGASGFGPVLDATGTNVGSYRLIRPQSNNYGIDAEPGLAYVRSGGAHNGRVYLVYTDAVDTATDDTDIYMRYSDDDGANWSSRVKVNDDASGNSQFLPRIALDQTSGNVAISWHDSRRDCAAACLGNGSTNGTANDDAELWATFSMDGGATFAANIKVSNGTSNSADSEPPARCCRPLGYGDYAGLAFQSGAFYPSWADNSNSTGDNPNGALSKMDVYTARVTLVDTADVSVAKTGPASVTPGADLTYSLTVTNGGPADASNVSLTDTIPAVTQFVSASQNTGPGFACTNPPAGSSGKMKCTIGTLLYGESATFNLVVHVGPGATGSISNTADVSAANDSNPSNDSSTWITDIVPQADLSIAKEHSVIGPAGAGLVMWNITITNNGPGDAQNVTMSDSLDTTQTNWVSSSASRGGSCSGTNTVTCSWTTLPAAPPNNVVTAEIVAGLLPVALQLSNTAEVSSATTDPDPSNNSALDRLEVPTQADVSVTQTAQVTGAGKVLQYILRVNNAGPSVARGVQLADKLLNPAAFVSVKTTFGSCTGGATVKCALGTATTPYLARDLPATITIQIKLTQSIPWAKNTATVTATTFDPNPSNNTSTIFAPLSGSMNFDRAEFAVLRPRDGLARLE